MLQQNIFLYFFTDVILIKFVFQVLHHSIRFNISVFYSKHCQFSLITFNNVCVSLFKI